MNDCIYALKRKVLTIFGDIKIFKWPFFVIYQPTSFRVKGVDTREIMANIAPGDVVMRAYDDYLDGYLYPKVKADAAIAVFTLAIIKSCIQLPKAQN